jgi:hypothetical protein
MRDAATPRGNLVIEERLVLWDELVSYVLSIDAAGLAVCFTGFEEYALVQFAGEP